MEHLSWLMIHPPAVSTFSSLGWIAALTHPACLNHCETKRRGNLKGFSYQVVIVGEQATKSCYVLLFTGLSSTWFWTAVHYLCIMDGFGRR